MAWSPTFHLIILLLSRDIKNIFKPILNIKN